MSLRLRLIVAAAAAVAVAVVLVLPGAYVIVRHELRHQVDESLVRRLSTRLRVSPGPSPNDPNGPGAGRRFDGETATIQIVSAGGQILLGNGTPLPVTSSDRALAAGAPGIRTRDAHVGTAHLRVASRGLGEGLAVVVAQPLDAVDGTLHRLVLLLALLAMGGVALAAGLGTVVARAALSPVLRLTEAADRVATTRDLTATIEVHGADEVARLARTINAMLVALDESQRAQRRLVADASHELRTPLTSLRTNLEVLARTRDMPEVDRQALLADLITQVTELAELVGQLVDLDRTDVVTDVPEPVFFDEIVASAVARARRSSPELTFTTSLEPTVVVGLTGLLERAAANLCDNAAKWSPPGATVEVTVAGGVLRVRDHGPGIDPEDVAHVFDRFYRSAAARGLPGSGLGLSIVKEAAEAHHGRAWVEPAPGGGTVAGLALPVGSHTPVQEPDSSLIRAASTSTSAADAFRQPSISAPFPGSSDL